MPQSKMHRFRRRLRTYSGRAMSTILGGPSHPVFFMHLPKCGGTSISEALYATIPLHKRIGVIDANATRRAAAICHQGIDALDKVHDDLPNASQVYQMREQMLITHMAWNSPMIHGHVLFSKAAYQHFGHIYKYATVLREPVSRVLSNYAHAVSAGFIENDFDAYLNGTVIRAHALTFLRFFSGQPVISVDQEADALALAITNFDRFDIVGFLDDLSKFRTQYKTVIGARPRIPMYNRAVQRTAPPCPSQLEALKAIMKTELRFWDYAVSSRHAPDRAAKQ